MIGVIWRQRQPSNVFSGRSATRRAFTPIGRRGMWLTLPGTVHSVFPTGSLPSKGIAHRCGSVVTDMALPPSLRTANTAFSNCAFYVNGGCKACIARCPAGAITEAGPDKNKCYDYQRAEFAGMREKLKVGNTGCGLCQTKVPCEFKIPVTKR